MEVTGSSPVQIAFYLKTQSRIWYTVGMKTCSMCTEAKDLSEFNRKGSGYQSRCRLCNKISTKAHYKANKAHYRRKIRERDDRVLAENIRRIYNYLAEHPCVDCGESDRLVLQFDHLRDKHMAVSTMLRHGYAWPKIEDEISKCEVRCANCHTRRTAQQFGWAKARLHD